MSGVKVKICGVTDPGFARAASAAGVDYIGAIFAAGSPRRVSPARAAAIAAAARNGARAAAPRIVGVFAGEEVREILRIARSVPLDAVQLHAAYGESTVRAIRAAGFETWLLDAPAGSAADAVLLDGRRGAMRGGTGALADWALARKLKRAGRRVVLAGGISAANAAEAAATGADVLDANSSLETAPGVKSVRLLEEFMQSIRFAH